MPAATTGEALAAIRAWVRFDQALAAFNRSLEAEFRITGAQLAMLRIIEERAPVTLAELRAALIMHPATLGQLVGRLAERGLVTRSPDPADRRRRRVLVTARGRRLLGTAPVAGPVRLRSVPVEADRLTRVAQAFNDVIDLFGLGRWATP